MLYLLVIVCFVGPSVAQTTETIQTRNDTEDLNNLSKFATPCTTPNDDLALCIEIDKCRLFSRDEILPSHESYEFIKASNCGPANAKIPRICCGKYKNFLSVINKDTVTNKPQSLLPQNSLQQNFTNPLPKNCGIQKLVNIRNRIFGGIEASLGEFPWLVRLIHRSPSGYKNFGCGAFLIHNKFVLTAAHCVSSKSTDIFGPLIQVVLGDHDFETDIDCTKTKPRICADKPVYIDTSPPVIYSGYKNEARNHNNDVAIIPLRHAVNFTDFIQPLCLLEAPSQMQTMYITGWGKTESDDKSMKKLKVEVPRVDLNVCTEKYKTIDVILNQKNQICAGAEGKDSCSGDSGGPLMMEQDGIWYAEGIVSFGYGCAKADWPGVYTNVPKYAEWIQKTINRKLEAKKKRKRNN